MKAKTVKLFLVDIYVLSTRTIFNRVLIME
jgi:hypothetical protein